MRCAAALAPPARPGPGPRARRAPGDGRGRGDLTRRPRGPPAGRAGKEADKLNKHSKTRRRRLSYAGSAGLDSESDDELELGGSNPLNQGEEDIRTKTGRRRRGSFRMEEDKNVDTMPASYSEEADLMTLEIEGTKVKVMVSLTCLAGQEPSYKKTNQDNGFVKQYFQGANDAGLYAVFDGHGPYGHYVSRKLKNGMQATVANQLEQTNTVPEALINSFLEIDGELKNGEINVDFSGSTAVVAHLKNNVLTTAWVGDSRGVLAQEIDNDLQAMDLTVDHKPITPEENERILKTGGRVERLVDELGEQVGPFRVWLSNAWVPGLAMSRALGDRLAHKAGVISTPDTFIHEITLKDRFIVLASDGVWEFIGSEEAVSIVARCYTPAEACEKLAAEARQRWLVEECGVVDDITVLIVAFAEVEEDSGEEGGDALA